MCGIAGFVGLGSEQQLQAMCATLVHRGPDDVGSYWRPGVGLAMRRLAVIDLLTGHQPISNETGDIWVVFNGEIYNYQEIRADLVKRGHALRTASDTETIVHLYEDFGVDCVEHLRGMFAFALWDEPRKRLLIARDRIGEKPLYYASTPDGLLFGSEIKAILRTGIHRNTDPQAVCDFLAAGYVSGSRTFYQGVHKLPPAHRLLLDAGAGTPKVERYWRPRPRTDVPRFVDAADQLRQHLEEVVRLCLKSDVEVGAFLSGGIDSSVIVALMRRHSAQVRTFAVGYRGAAEGFNELKYARDVANHLGSVHSELLLEAVSSIELLPKVLGQYDEPHGEPTSVLVYLLSEFTRRSVTVAMAGTGGDEIFFGYPRHRGLRMLEWYQHIPKAARRHLIERVVERWPESTRGSRFAKRARRFIRGANLVPVDAYVSWISLFDANVRAELLSDSVVRAAADSGGLQAIREYLEADDTGSVYDRAASVDIEAYLPEYQLAYIDRMSMAHSLEVRSPLCDYRLVEFVRRLPVEHRLRGLRSKHIFKEVAKSWLPKAIVDRKKVGFDSPIGQWLKDELRSFVVGFLAPEQVRRSGLLDADAVQSVLREHLSGARDYSLQLWSLIALEAWHRMFIEDQVNHGDDYQIADMRGSESLTS